MQEMVSGRKKESNEKKSTSLQRSMDIFLRLTNLSMEWNMSCFVGSFVSYSEREKYWDDMHKKMAMSIVDNIKSLKGCWVKLGQFLSTKSGFLPPYYLEALTELQDYMPNSDFTEIIETIEDDLGFMDEIYSNFDTIPIASASIAQVHKASLIDGSIVAVKVQHKSSEQNLLNDIEILKMITRMMHAAGVYADIRDYFDEYSTYAAKELDFTNEARNIELSIMDAIKSKVPVRIPKLHKEYCSRHVITMEFYDLNKFSDREFLKKFNVNLPQVIYDLHDFAFFQIMNCGRLHSDPHPGNLQLHYDPKDKNTYPVFLDWGFTTHVDDMSRIGISNLYKSVYTYDAMGTATAMLDTGFIPLETYPFRYDSLFDSFIGILLSAHKLSFASRYNEADAPDGIIKTRDLQAKVHRLIHDFIFMYFKKAPNFIPLTLKMMSELQSLSKSLGTFAPFMHLSYKNASCALYSLYDSPLNYYYSCLGLPLLQNKLNSVKFKLNTGYSYRRNSTHEYSGDGQGYMSRLRRFSFYDMLEKVSNDSLKRNKNFRIFSELVIPESKNLLESRLSDLFRYFYQDSSNVIAIQVGIIRNGAIEVELSFGNMDKYEKRPISNESLFPLINISSGFMTIAVLHLASIGKLGLDDRVHIYWPEFKPNKEFVTIRDILERKCGAIYTDFPFVDICTSRATMCKCVENAQFFYHNKGVDNTLMFYSFILSEIITRVTKVPTEEFVMMLTSMVGIDSSNMLYPNPVDVNTREDAGNDGDESDNASNSDEGDDIGDFTKNLNMLFEQSVEVFGDHLPLLNMFNIIPSTNSDSGSESIASSDESSKSSCKEYSDSSESVRGATARKTRGSRSGDNKKTGAPTANKRKLSPRSKKQYEHNNNRIKIVSLDGDCLDSKFKHVNLDIEEFRKKLSFQSTVIDIPTDDHGDVDSTYYCSCYKYDKDFPDDELRRCYVPTKYCPVKNRLVKVFRGKSEDSVIPRFSKLFDEKDTDLPCGNYDPDYCSLIIKQLKPEMSSEDHISLKIRESIRRTFSQLYDSDEDKRSESMETSDQEDGDNGDKKGKDGKDPTKDSEVIGQMGRLTKTRTKVCFNENKLVKLEGFTFCDLVRFKCNMIDPIVANYAKFYESSVPFLNARSNALSLSLFYYSVMNGSLISSELLDQVMKNNNYDNLLLCRFFIGMFKPRFSLGFQKFAFVDRDGKHCEGFGHSDISGSVVMAIPSHNLAITILVSHYTRQFVFIKILQFVLENYGLRLIDYTTTYDNFYRILALL